MRGLTPPQIFLLKISKILWGFSEWVLQSYRNIKNMFSVGIKVTIASIDVIFRQWQEEPEGVTWRASMKKVLLKISQGPQKKNCAGVSFLIKIQVGDLQLYYKETPVLVFFL